MQDWHMTKRLGTTAAGAVWLSLAICVLSVQAAEPPKRAPQLVIAQLGNPAALNSWNWTAGSESDILSHIQESLMQYDRQAKLQPLLAERVEMNSATDWILKVRQGVKFHDPNLGEMTADDVKASIDANLRNGTGHALRVPAVMRAGTVEVIDTYTLRWKLKEPGLVTLPQWLTGMYVNSKKYLEREDYEAAGRRP
jgi:ABC-type transport system substrate-binding protein